ncbi:uncharacterized protein N7483_011448 [Penicillium malachiteum]|uniref:uncharacterized protein n=1 Tax=Penicillium malachiteum TaxID=1324776 RepID=UPI002546DC7A|nr:uncharacterized protein N7483_011448 [Penicillium malachiteum]KAJ5714267.1 hypothetical protein N7483_011448 [Penicillium malachiteum]
MSTTQTKTQPTPVSIKVEPKNDFLNKIIDNFNQLTRDPDFQKASATYVQVKEQQEQIRLRDEKLTRLQNDMKIMKEKEIVTISQLSEVNQTLTTQKDAADKKNEALQKEATEREKSTSEMTRRIQQLQEQVQARLSEKDKKELEMKDMEKKHSGSLDDLQKKLKKGEVLIEGLNATNANLTTLLNAEKAKSGSLEEEKKSLDQTMKSTQGQLEKFNTFVVKSPQVEEQSIIKNFSNLWNFAAKELWVVLQQDLNFENLRNDDTSWKKFISATNTATRDPTHGQSIPLCASNSDSAKGMRLALMLSILSRAIDKEIFQPSYFPSETGHLRTSLSKLVDSDHKKEQFYRSVLLSIDRDGQEAELKSRAKTVVHNVSYYLFELLSTTQYGELKERIENIVQSAIKVWRPIQHAPKKYETEFDSDDWSHEDDALFQFPVGNPDQIGAEQSSHHLLVIFPGLYSFEPESFILAPVIPLMSSQKFCVAATQELREEARGLSSPVTKQSKTKRKNSIAQSNVPTFLGKHSSGASGN